MKLWLLFSLLLSPTIVLADGGDFISYLCTDGVKHAGGGIKVSRDGQLSRLFKDKDMPAPLEVPAGKNSDSANKIFTLSETNGFLETSYDHGKCSIMYHSSKQEHLVQYSSKAPKPIKDLFDELQAVYRSAVELRPK